MCEAGQGASNVCDVRDFVTPAEGGSEFDALVDLICAGADADSRGCSCPGAASTDPNVAALADALDALDPLDSPLSTPSLLIGVDPGPANAASSANSTNSTNSAASTNSKSTALTRATSRPRLSPLIRHALVSASRCTRSARNSRNSQTVGGTTSPVAKRFTRLVKP